MQKQVIHTLQIFVISFPNDVLQNDYSNIQWLTPLQAFVLKLVFFLLNSQNKTKLHYCHPVQTELGIILNIP